MKEQKLANDAASSTKGTIYQLYVAVKKCFELTSGQKVIVERYGDVTVSGSQQIETKHYGDSLTDNHPNFWNTLKNWMQDDFDVEAYSALILCTTQQIGSQSRFATWNKNSTEERLAVLKAIFEEAEAREAKREKKAGEKVPEVLRLQRWIMDSTRETKLTQAVGRFVIADMSPDLDNLYAVLKDVYCKGILEAKCDAFLHGLLGYVICPTVVNGNSWEVTYNDFQKAVSNLTSQFCQGTRQFPVKYFPVGPTASKDLVTAKQDELFVLKIRDIQYDKEIPKAVSDYVYASETVLKELREYQVPFSKYQIFAQSVLDTFRPRHRRAIREMKEIITCSQNFYDDCMLQPVPEFPGFGEPPVPFRNGVIHMLCDDPEQNIKWRLEE